METLDPPSPQKIKIGKMARFCPSRGFILDLVGWGQGGGGGGKGGEGGKWGVAVPSYSAQDCSLGCTV